ncbi:histidine kinase [Parasphingorhabdus sp.]|uniref:histidine kinase n=1 Tax=Parasphingorhabdus sp. TaxID=2709688 RepID=UPI002F935C40
MAIQTLLLRYFLPAIAVIAIALAIFVYNRIYDTILEGFDAKLETTSALTGALIDPADHDWLIEKAREKGGLSESEAAQIEQSAQYLQNAVPMRNILKELDLTYLYTQLIVGEGDILYILDATQGDDHSPLGTMDQLPAETMDGLRKIAKDSSIYISPIEYQEQWGLLKTAAAPVGSMDSNIAASAGADVNISVIQIATQNILFASALIGLVSLIACGLVTLMLVRRIAVPIAQLKRDALKIAAGKLAPPEQHVTPREAALLGDSLANITRKISSKRDDIQVQTHISKRKQDAELIDNILSADGQGRTVRLVDNDSILAVWIARNQPAPQMNLKMHAMKMLSGRIAQDDGLASKWLSFIDTAQESVIILDRATGVIQLTGSLTIEIYKGDERDTAIPFSPGDKIDLGEADKITLLLDQSEIAVNLLRGRLL